MLGPPEKLATDIQNIAKKAVEMLSWANLELRFQTFMEVLMKTNKLMDNTAMSKMSQIPELIGVNYWTGFGGSTELWDEKYNNPENCECY